MVVITVGIVTGHASSFDSPSIASTTESPPLYRQGALVVASSPPVQPALRVMVRAGMTAGQALRDGGAPTTGPDATVVARDAQGGLRDLTWAPESDTEVEAVAANSPDGRSVIRHSCAHVLAQGRRGRRGVLPVPRRHPDQRRKSRRRGVRHHRLGGATREPLAECRRAADRTVVTADVLSSRGGGVVTAEAAA